jgi:hypothetical protein
MQRQASLVRTCVAVAVLGLTGVAVGCGENANPVRPSQLSGAGQAPATAAAAAFAANGNLTAHASAEHLNPTELEQRGWTCFQPRADRIACSRPNQGRPTIPPPDDRPASFTFLAFDANGRFVGTVTLLRTDLYNGQICGSSGEPWVFLPVIGYYECLHTAGA